MIDEMRINIHGYTMRVKFLFESIMRHPTCFMIYLVLFHIQSTGEIKFISKAIREFWQTLTNSFICLPVAFSSAHQREINIREGKTDAIPWDDDDEKLLRRSFFHLMTPHGPMEYSTIGKVAREARRISGKKYISASLWTYENYSP